MKTPPFLLGAALLFWGWQTDLFIAGAVMAVVLESARFIKVRWELSNEDFSRIWTFCAVLFLATGAYAFTASNGPANLGAWFASGDAAARGMVGGTSAKTAVLLIRWLPMAFFLFIAAQVFSDREAIPLETISLILRRRWRQALKSGRPVPQSRNVNVAYPYFIACVFAASSHAPAHDDYFYWGLWGLLAWALWSQRSRRFGLAVWAGTIVLAAMMGYAGERGLVHLRRFIDDYNPQWLGGLAHQGFDPLETRTEIGQIGRIKLSSQIVIRLTTPEGGSAPAYLREAGYGTYKSGVWYAANFKDDFNPVVEQPADSGAWPLVPGKSNADTVNIACYLPGNRGLLPLPAASGRLEQLPVFNLQKNSFGAVRAEGPGLVIFNALYGPGAVIDHAPDPAVDLAVPDREKPALDQVVAQLHLSGLDHSKTLQAISHYFGTQFTYSLWQEAPKLKDTNTTALSRFLLKSRSGHCEYFATATVLLLRELGIAARYNVGYAVRPASGNQAVVRQSDAHSWCRVWNEQTREWEDFDTTPGTWLAMESGQAPAWQFLADAWSRVFFEFSKFRWGQANLRQYILWALLPVLALLLYQIIFRSGRRRQSSILRTEPDKVLRLGLDSEFFLLERELAQRGFVRHPGESASFWLRRMATEPTLSGFEDSVSRLVKLHYRHRFDPQGLDEQERERLRCEVRDCLAEMHARAST